MNSSLLTLLAVAGALFLAPALYGAWLEREAGRTPPPPLPAVFKPSALPFIFVGGCFAVCLTLLLVSHRPGESWLLPGGVAGFLALMLWLVVRPLLGASLTVDPERVVWSAGGRAPVTVPRRSIQAVTTGRYMTLVVRTAGSREPVILPLVFQDNAGLLALLRPKAPDAFSTPSGHPPTP